MSPRCCFHVYAPHHPEETAAVGAERLACSFATSHFRTVTALGDDAESSRGALGEETYQTALACGDFEGVALLC